MHFSLRSLAWVVVALYPLFTSAGPVYSGEHGRRSPSEIVKAEIVERNNTVYYEPAKKRRAMDIQAGEKTILRPISEEIFGLEKRGLKDISRLDLLNDCHMTFGAEHGDEGKAFLASMIMSPPNGEKVVMMEKFKKLVKDATCIDQNGHIKVMFHSLEEFQYAKKAWQWINAEKDKSFLLVANDESCGPEDQRYPYRVTHIHCDEATLTATLDAEKLPWKSVASDFTVKYGHIDLSENEHARQALSLSKRGIDRRTPWNFEKSIQKNWDLNAGKPGRFNIFTDILQNFPRLVIDCVDCMIRGSIQLQGDIKVRDMKVESAWFDVKPQDFYNKMQLDISYYQADGLGPHFRIQEELAAIGLGPLIIPHIFELGPKVAWEIGAQVTALGLTNVSVGVETNISNDAYLRLDLKDHEKSTAQGLRDSHISPIFNINSAQITLGAAAYNQAEIALAFNVLDVINYEAALQLKLPIVNANVSAVYNQNGVCSKGVGAAKYGIITQSAIALEAWFVLGKIQLFGITNGPGPANFFNRKLFGMKWPFFDLCRPFVSLPKVGPSAPKQPLPNAPRETVGATKLPKNAFDQDEPGTAPMTEQTFTKTTMDEAQNPMELPQQVPPKQPAQPSKKHKEESEDETGDGHSWWKYTRITPTT